ncbi:MAG TPA: glycoside hydrolase family 97 protein [bacterium]|nr:glycoside hydrolase family 97 protein [bacterium]HPG46293.1 glycoside hydrolase family 97 protein [bacterium]HPM98513.1 glycoside hydrolase family 97 protein [bacterium]
MRLCISILLLFFLIFSQPCAAQPLSVSSPNASLRLTFSLHNGAPTYQLDRFNRPVILPSRLGFVLKDQPPLAYDFTIAAVDSGQVDQTWIQPWGEKKEIRDRHNELAIVLQEKTPSRRNLILVFRLFDDGLGFRYEFPLQPESEQVAIMDELTEFNLAADAAAWWIGAYQWNRYEYLYQKTRASDITVAHTPVTLETDDGLFLSIHEAALTDYASMALRRTSRTGFQADLVPWSDGIRVRSRTPFKTPWRTVQISDSAGGLITSYLILNLNEPNVLGDVSWVKPGKYVGIWWEMHLDLSTWHSGPRHGATTANAKRYIDFAAEYGFDGVLVEGWNLGWDGDWVNESINFDFTTPYPDFDIEAVARYARDKGVRLIGHHETGGGVRNYAEQMEEAFAFYQRLGVNTVKTGYVGHGQSILRLDENGVEQGEWHHGQYMVQQYRLAVETAAKHQIMLDVHEPIKDTGIRRTYPNMMTREGARGMEYDAWSPDGGNPPDHTTILPFTRLLAGPMDYTPGIFDLLYPEIKPDNRVNTTLAKQLALYVVIYSPLHMAADLPENYRARPGPFQFIVDVPTDWHDTRVLHARIGDYITVVRQQRDGSDWFLGSITDDQGRILDAPLAFLEPGQKYVATIYRDAPDADWRTQPYAIEITEQLVDANTVLSLRLAPGGGQAIRFRPATKADRQKFITSHSD